MRHYGLFTFIALLLVAAGCSSPASTAKSPAAVEIRTFEFTPGVLDIARGTTVTWTNRDDILHTATAGTAIKKDDFGNYDRKPTGTFDGRMEKPGASYSFTFAEAGEFTYYCDRHAHMTGKIVVK